MSQNDSSTVMTVMRMWSESLNWKTGTICKYDSTRVRYSVDMDYRPLALNPNNVVKYEGSVMMTADVLDLEVSILPIFSASFISVRLLGVAVIHPLRKFATSLNEHQRLLNVLIFIFLAVVALFTMATAATATAPLTEEIKETATLTEVLKEVAAETTNVGEESELALKEDGDVGESNAVAKASDTSAASTSSNSLLLGCGDTSSIRSILCAAPLAGDISDDVDEAQKSFLGMFSKKQEKEDDGTLDEITAESDISKPERRIWVVTTAGLPWRTGTAVNPLLRALYLTRGRPKGFVTLVIPWLNSTSSRVKLYGEENSFSGGQKEQEAWIRAFCRERAQCEDEEKNLNILFYPAVYRKEFGSIFPSVDVSSLIPDEEADVAILEEPEHLNWFRVPPPETGDEKAVTEEAKAESDDSGTEESIAETMKREKAELCWRKFRHVVGIIHTNYSAYMTQYAVGTSIIAAPALSMLSSIVVRAYCQRVIRLSAALPSLAPNKEVTCNVHGVRSEFLEPCKIQATSDNDATEEEPPAAVYFIGKVIWAKGFDWLLQIEDHFRYATGHYFPVDVYGGGPDEKAISRAFLGRNVQLDKKQPSIEPSLSEDDATAAAIFSANESLRNQVEHLKVETDIPAIEVVQDDSSPTGSSVQITEARSSDGFLEDEEEEGKDESSPLAVIGDLSSNTVATGIATSQAVYSLADRIVKAGMKMTFAAKETTGMEGEAYKQVTSKFSFDPPKSTYELRRTPIPARFLGVKDHVLMRDISDHKIFLNASITEVLCTTTAEALAMGKFAVIPKHASNEFFYQFQNCLTFETTKECVEKLQWALDNTPVPLTDEERHKFTWEGATDRLFEYSGITKREMRERERSGSNKADSRIAWFHTESGRTGNFIGKLYSRMSSAVSESKSEGQSGSVEN